MNFHAATEFFQIETERGRVVVERDYGEGHGMILEDPPIRQCANFCPFCFVDQGPKTLRMRKGLEIKDDDYRYSFLYGHYVTLTNLSRADFARISEMRLSPLYVSVHATDPEIRAKALGRPKADPMPILRKLHAAGIELHTQIVMIPGLNDGDVMRQTIDDLREVARTVAVVPVGLTSHHEQGVARWTPESARSALDDVLALGGDGYVQAADEWFSMLGIDPPEADYYGGMAVEENGVGMVRRMLDEWKTFKLPRKASVRARVITGKSPEIYIRRIIDEMNRIPGVDLELHAAENTTYGPDTTVTGLLAWRDIEPFARGTTFIPRVLLNGANVFLDDVRLEDIQKDHDIRVVESSARGLFSILK